MSIHINLDFLNDPERDGNASRALNESYVASAIGEEIWRLNITRVSFHSTRALGASVNSQNFAMPDVKNVRARRMKRQSARDREEME